MEYKYSASTAKDFVGKISLTGLGEIVAGKTKKLIIFILPQKKPNVQYSPMKRFLDHCALLVTEEDPKRKKEKLSRVFF